MERAIKREMEVGGAKALESRAQVKSPSLPVDRTPHSLTLVGGCAGRQTEGCV